MDIRHFQRDIQNRALLPPRPIHNEKVQGILQLCSSYRCSQHLLRRTSQPNMSRQGLAYSRSDSGIVHPVQPVVTGHRHRCCPVESGIHMSHLGNHSCHYNYMEHRRRCNRLTPDLSDHHSLVLRGTQYSSHSQRTWFLQDSHQPHQPGLRS